METVKVVCCQGCHLRWIDDGRFDRCPHCRRWNSIAAGEVRLKVVEGELEGPEPILPQPPDLGLCPHGLLTSQICVECNLTFCE